MGNGTPEPSGPMIEAEDLTKVFGAHAAVSGVSFGIPRGQVAAFLGPNGAGKTTAMRMLTGYLAPTSGQARIAGFDVASQRLEAAERVGYLPENGPLYGDMVPRALLRFFGAARGMDSAKLKERMEAVATLLHIGDVMEKPIRKLSRGYKQRVGMAHALLHEPDVMIMDEPTSGLDPNQIRDVRRAIREIGRARTILLSTHILQEVEAVADRVLLIHRGGIVFDGTPEEMKKDGSMEEFFHRMTPAGEGTP
ncbi:MAG: ABC transporter ATP-binding protein [Planctomycetota bacterium]|jgi:ABC-2 type transport system ATP-binding protein